MPLSLPSTRRALKHACAIRIEDSARDDGSRDSDAHMTDIPNRDTSLAIAVRAAGALADGFRLPVTTTRDPGSVNALPVLDTVACPAFRERVASDCRNTIGHNVRYGFRQGVRHRSADVKGGARRTAAEQVLPAVVVRAFTGERLIQRDEHTNPYELDGCHALRTDGPVAARFYPGWANTSVAES